MTLKRMRLYRYIYMYVCVNPERKKIYHGSEALGLPVVPREGAGGLGGAPGPTREYNQEWEIDQLL